MAVTYNKINWDEETPITLDNLDRIEVGIDEVVTQSNSNESRISTNEDDIFNHEGRITTNENDISSLETEQSDQDDRITTNENDISSLEAEQSDQDGRITANEDDISDNESRITTNENDLDDKADNPHDNTQHSEDYVTQTASEMEVLRIKSIAKGVW